MRTTVLHLFTPHHTNNYRARILHPAGLTVLVGLFLLTQTWVRLLTLVPALPGGWVLGYASNISSGQTISSTNSERAKLGLAPLTVNPILSQAAAAKANHMFANDYWAHIAPDGTSPWVFIKGAGYQYSVAGENLARDFDTTGAMLTAWMNSPTHRENIVNTRYSEIGIAVVNGTLQGIETTLVVQMFGKPTTAIAQTGTAGIVDTANAKEEVVAAPATTPVPKREITPTVEPTTTAIAQVDSLQPPEQSIVMGDDALGTTLTAPSVPQSKILVSPLLITKAVTTSIILMLLGVLLYDLFYISRKKIPRRVGKNWAHLTFLAFVLIFVALISGGKII